MTLQEAKSIARHLGLTLRKVRSGDFRVTFRDGHESAAYYTDNLEDAVNTAVEMARKRAWELRGTELGRDLTSTELEMNAEPAEAEPVALRHVMTAPMPHSSGGDEQIPGEE